jgi:ribonuclease HI
MACKTLYQRKNRDITIRTDSQAAITAIKGINITSNTVLDCKKWLNKLGGKNRVTLAWIKAHAGHPGNDQADALAKQGWNRPIRSRTMAERTGLSLKQKPNNKIHRPMAAKMGTKTG